ncbi:hypothetical protein [Nonomuraea helvata]|uniref:Tetracyclin repressor-like C-terminal domain-containing protein n=1 Tax=Nonomuraea helvata TaxID=37484 RepID=A0ABV5SBL4_9ACTN
MLRRVSGVLGDGVVDGRRRLVAGGAPGAGDPPADEGRRDDSAFDGDAPLLAAFFIAGYTAVLVETARRLIAGEPADTVADDHRARLEHLFDALSSGVVPRP